MANRTLQYLAAAGVVGPVLFTLVWLVLGFLDPTHSHIEHVGSRLGAVGAPNAIAMNINFFVFGLLTIAFALGLQRGLPPGLWVGPALVAIGGAGIFAAGIFPLVEPDVVGSPQNLPHGIAAVFAFLSLTLAPLLLSPRLKRDPGWQNLRWYSIATFIVALVLFFSMPLFVPWGVGLHQRLFLAVVFVWIVVMAVRLFRQASASVSPSS